MLVCTNIYVGPLSTSHKTNHKVPLRYNCCDFFDGVSVLFKCLGLIAIFFCDQYRLSYTAAECYYPLCQSSLLKATLDCLPGTQQASPFIPRPSGSGQNLLG